MMDDNEVRLNEPLPAPVIEGVRAAYAPPAGEAYWMSLESRIMARIADTATARWWVVLGTWARGGIVAAAAVLVAAVVLATHPQDRAHDIQRVLGAAACAAGALLTLFAARLWTFRHRSRRIRRVLISDDFSPGQQQAA